MKKIIKGAAVVLVVILALSALGGGSKDTKTAEAPLTTAETIAGSTEHNEEDSVGAAAQAGSTVTVSEIAEYSGETYVTVNDNEPFFTEDEYTTEVFETYSDLDSLGRCGVAYANLCTELMPTEARESIREIIPSGWHNASYDFIEDGYVYNRCHLIGFQLAGESANEKNLITGTRYLNLEGMLPFENMVADFVREMEYHVLYRVTPVYDGDNLVASGVLMEAWSVEDEGEGICFNVYCYNVQPGVTIDYATGYTSADGTVTASAEETEEEITTVATVESSGRTYILNTNTKKFHLPSCSAVERMSEKNREEYTGSRDDVIGMGYEPCKICDP
ncbi:MAG: DNA/RNA non-specific endonuclease [Lachnospiraceae bacterium]|nr:DNA/RNA non-specific endonuclease [Lachnospiraceae bacterium]